ncbi:hypothetical protein [Rhodobacter viridis]|uniref:hypothetical protein n=1 Tax=Rhodobacter viridis TaxID=1054202 RepID=UPI0015E8BE95|nr:hypothetical protein [Rhodobacter viridis]
MQQSHLTGSPNRAQLGGGDLVFDRPRFLLVDLGGQKITNDLARFMLAAHKEGDPAAEAGGCDQDVAQRAMDHGICDLALGSSLPERVERDMRCFPDEVADGDSRAEADELAAL